MIQFKNFFTVILLSSLFANNALPQNINISKAQKDTDGVYYVDVKTDLKEIDSRKENIFQVMTMFVIGTGLVHFYKYKKMSMDMMVASGAGVAYMAGEATNIKGFRKGAESLKVKIKQSQTASENNQRESLFRELETYEGFKTSLKNTQKLQKSALAAVMMAEGVAVYQVFQLKSLYNSCAAKIGSAETILNIKASAQGKVKIDAEDCKEQLAAYKKDQIDNIEGLITNYKLETSSAALEVKILKTSPITEAKIKTEGLCAMEQTVNDILPDVRQACGKYLDYVKETSAFGQAFKADGETVNLDFKTLFNLMIPEAHAALGPLGLLGLSAGALIALTAETQAFSNHIDTLMYSPYMRVKAWPLVAGMVAMSIAKTKENISKTDSNIEKIKALIAQIDKSAQGIQASQASQVAMKTSYDFYSIPETINETQRVKCLTSDTSKCYTINSKVSGASLGGIEKYPFLSEATSIARSPETYQSKGLLDMKGFLANGEDSKLNSIGRSNNHAYKQLLNNKFGKDEYKSALASGEKFVSGMADRLAKGIDKSGAFGEFYGGTLLASASPVEKTSLKSSPLSYENQTTREIKGTATPEKKEPEITLNYENTNSIEENESSRLMDEYAKKTLSSRDVSLFITISNAYLRRYDTFYPVIPTNEKTHK